MNDPAERSDLCPDCGGTLPRTGPLSGLCPHCLLLESLGAASKSPSVGPV